MQSALIQKPEQSSPRQAEGKSLLKGAHFSAGAQTAPSAVSGSVSLAYPSGVSWDLASILGAPVDREEPVQERALLFGSLTQSNKASHPRIAAHTQQSSQPRLMRKCNCEGSCSCGKSEDQKQKDDDKSGIALQRMPAGSSLSVGSVDDPMERDADQIADQVLRMPASPATPSQGTQRIGQAHGLHRKPAYAAAPSTAPPIVHHVLRSPGQPLSLSTRNYFEPRFGVGLGDVRVHTGSDASESARSVNARAYTAGNHIVFADGQFSPGTAGGDRLLAHELAHTLQQGSIGKGRYEPVLRRVPGDPLEGLDTPDPGGSVTSVVVDSSSYRTRFYLGRSKTYDGKVTTLTSTFQPGDYLIERADPDDKGAIWKIFNTDGSKYRGGLQFSVFLDGPDPATLSYNGRIPLKVATGLLPRLIDLNARLQSIKQSIEKGAKDVVIVALFDDIPVEQAAAFVKMLREEKVGDMPLLDKLDHYVDGEDNMKLHMALSKLKLQAGGVKSAEALADAPTLAWHDVMGFFEQKAVFSVTRSGNGKYRIKYLGAVSGGLYSSPDFSEIKSMNKKERLNIMTGDGIEVDADQPIIVHDYDNDKTVVLTAEDLISYQHAGVRKFLQDVGTIAALATPAGAESVGAKVLQYGIQIATVATLIVDENKLNIKRWFPNWGPAIIDVSEKIKIVIAVVGVAQFVQGSWKLVSKLRQLRAARAAMDAKAVVGTAEELVEANKQAEKLEASADKLLSTADLARQELGLTEDLEQAGATTGQAAGDASKAGVISPADKTRIIDSAISRKDFVGDFSNLASKELGSAAHNPSRVRPSHIPGYNLEVPIEGTDHFLARRVGGGWCVFSGTPSGCGAIAVPSTVDELFAEMGRELGLEKVTTQVGNQTKVDIAKAVQDAKDAGFIGPAGEPVAVDLSVQPHSAASETRSALGVSGKDVQSAHHGPTSGLKGVSGYSRDRALTVLLPRATHKAFDDTWKQWSIAQRQAGKTQTTVSEFLRVVDDAIDKTPNISPKTKGAMSTVLFNEFYRDLGLKPDDLLDLPYSNIK